MKHVGIKLTKYVENVYKTKKYCWEKSNNYLKVDL